jgi:hypothetical protein
MIRLRVCLVEIRNEEDTAQAATAGHCASHGRLASGLAIKTQPKKPTQKKNNQKSPPKKSHNFFVFFFKFLIFFYENNTNFSI